MDPKIQRRPSETNSVISQPKRVKKDENLGPSPLVQIPGNLFGEFYYAPKGSANNVIGSGRVNTDEDCLGQLKSIMGSLEEIIKGFFWL